MVETISIDNNRTGGMCAKIQFNFKPFQALMLDISAIGPSTGGLCMAFTTSAGTQQPQHRLNGEQHRHRLFVPMQNRMGLAINKIEHRGTVNVSVRAMLYKYVI